jgi:alpha,alpha-trehalase
LTRLLSGEPHEPPQSRPAAAHAGISITFAPNGAIVAAPTTSLPETIGGERNGDCRYTWVRDACLTMEALWVAACPDEAGKFFAFLADAAASQLRRGIDLQMMFGIGGERDLSERELPHLAGWRYSRPVRVGKGAWNQRQLDVYGELLGAAQRLIQQLGELDPITAVPSRRRGHRRQPPEGKGPGIWEIRGEPRDFLYSKLMCWVALDRAIDLAPQLGAGHRMPHSVARCRRPVPMMRKDTSTDPWPKQISHPCAGRLSERFQTAFAIGATMPLQPP